MIETAHGIILRTRPLTETSLIVNWLTPNHGRISTVAKGARRAKSPFTGKLDLFYEAGFSFSRSRKTDLHILREVDLKETHNALRMDISKLQMAAYSAHFVEQVTEPETPISGVFNLIKDFLSELCEAKQDHQIIFLLELKLLQELGLEPDLTESKLTLGTAKIVSIMTENNFQKTRNLKMTKAQETELKQFLHGFLIYHLGKLPKGRASALAETN